MFLDFIGITYIGITYNETDGQYQCSNSFKIMVVIVN